MGVRLRQTWDAAGASEALRELLRGGEDLTDLLDVIGAKLVTSTQRRFERELDPDGQPWVVSQRAALEGGQTLTDTARLKSSITHQVDSRHVDVGTNVIYAAVHQFGAKKGDFGQARQLTRNRIVPIPWGDIPDRRFLGISREDGDVIEELVVARWRRTLNQLAGGAP